MAKYQLVASHYNSHTGKYENEQVVNIPGVDLTTLIAIDRFTCTHTKDELISMIKKENNISDYINTLSIRYYKNSESSPSYYQIVTNSNVIKSVLEDIKQKQFNGKKNRLAYGIDKNNEAFCAEERNLIQLIESRNLAELDRLVYKNSDLRYLIDRYLSSYYDNEAAKENDLAQIVLEFSRYKTFRGWVVANSKKYEKKYQKTTYKKPIVPSKEKIEVKSIEQHEMEYEKSFEEKHNITYMEQTAYDYNTRDLEDDKEEFIEPCELEQMGHTK